MKENDAGNIIMRLLKLNRVLHRDLGYFFFGMTLIYALSGIALNHSHEWNPNYIITLEEYDIETINDWEPADRETALKILKKLEIDNDYKTHLVSGSNFRIFVEGGSLTVNMVEGKAKLELIRKRPFFNQINILHYNTPRRMWTWFSDIYAGSLIIISITGLFIIRGKNGIKGRGAWLTGAGIIIPVIFLYLYL